MKKKLGIYIHIPFCLKKCNYCDFLSFGGTDEGCRAGYVTMLQQQIEAYSQLNEADEEEWNVDSVFIGGGTPSILEAEQLAAIMEKLRKSFHLDVDAEITIESNPRTLSFEKLKAYRRMGINRLSIGCQSTDDQLLAFMGRAHDARDFFNNYDDAREAGFTNINVDLMFGIKGQSQDMWSSTLNQVLALEPAHLSFYSLQVEEGTPFYELQRTGEGCQCTDEENRKMYSLALELLERRGYIHYEISNAAKPGYYCRHNLKYWQMKDYLGLGLGAHSFVNGVRFENTSVLETYINGEIEPVSIEKNSRQDDISDYLFTGLRRIEGIQNSDFHRRFGVELDAAWADKLEKFSQEGLVFFDGKTLRFTRKGLDFTNTVLRELI